MDHAATTPMREEVLEEMLPYLKEKHGTVQPALLAGTQSFGKRQRGLAGLGADPKNLFYLGKRSSQQPQAWESQEGSTGKSYYNQVLNTMRCWIITFRTKWL